MENNNISQVVHGNVPAGVYCPLVGSHLLLCPRVADKEEHHLRTKTDVQGVNRGAQEHPGPLPAKVIQVLIRRF